MYMVQCGFGVSQSDPGPPIRYNPLTKGSFLLNHLNPPYGDTLVQLIANGTDRGDMQQRSRDWPSLDLDPRDVCDLELLMSGGYSPLTGFMGSADVDAVCSSMRRIVTPPIPGASARMERGRPSPRASRTASDPATTKGIGGLTSTTSRSASRGSRGCTMSNRSTSPGGPMG